MSHEGENGELDSVQKSCVARVVQRHQMMAEKEKENNNDEVAIDGANAVGADNNGNAFDNESNGTMEQWHNGTQ